MAIRSLAHRSLAVGGALVAAAGGTLALAAGTAGASGPAALTSRTITLNDTGHLHRTSSKGFNLYESGQATGSISGTLYLHLDVVSTNRVTAELSVYPKGSSMSGNASGSYRNNGSTASFSGTLSITRGTGSYAHAHGSGLKFSGSIERSNDDVTVQVSGHLSA
jgi:hypothetical protein